MTVTHLQKFLFSFYPEGNIKSKISQFLNEFLKYYVIEESKLYS